MTWSQEEIDAFKARRAQGDGNLGKVDDFVCSDQAKTSPRKWGSRSSPSEETGRTDDWLGGSPAGKKRSWKVKSVKAVVPNLDD